MNPILKNFPKTRPSLPLEFQAIYAGHVKQNREGGSRATSLAQRTESWMHRKVAADLSSTFDGATLEIGAGTLNHLTYEKNLGVYDIVEPFRLLFESSPNIDLVRNVYDDITEVPDHTRYDRIVSIATFEHICDLPRVIARCGLLLRDDGQLRIGIPSEGTLLWQLGYRLTTGIEFRRKHGLDYEILMRYEHVNTAREIEGILKVFFGTVNRSVFGITRALSIYQFFACKDPFLDECKAYLESCD